MTLTPAYGRDYKSKKAVVEAFEANVDFILHDLGSRYDGKPCNRSDLQSAGIRQVRIRYAQLRKVTTVAL